MRLAASPDRVVLALPAGLRLRSAADRRSIDGGIAMFARAAAGSQRRVRLAAVPSGHWVAHTLPGVPREVADDPPGWPASAKPYHFAADDPAGRFLPLRFTSPLPARGALHWSGWSGWTGARRNRARPILPPDATAATIPDYLPLFPGPGWQPEPGLADVRAQLAIRETGGALRNAGWAVATIGIGNTVIGLGLADGEGRLVVAFPYPAMPQQTPVEAAQGRPNIAWQVRVRIYCSELAAGLEQGETPELQDILAQLDTAPIPALRTIMGSQPSLPDQELVLGQTLVLRTEIGGGKLSSSLFLKSP
jgi:hypothetical protein